MIDIHCHLLPGIDDGPDTLEQALQLAQQAVDDGVTHAVVTPHIHQGRWENNSKLIESKVQQFREHLCEEGVPLFIGMAAEVRVGPEVLQLISADQVPFLGRWESRRVVLLELPHSHVPPGSEKIVTWLLDRNILAMIAHPERNKDVMRNMAKLAPFIDLGCLFQVTAGAVAGQFGENAQKRSRQLLEQDLVTVLASDAHHIDRRPVNLSAGYHAAAAIVGEAAAQQLVQHNPLTIVREQFAELGCI